MTLDNGDEPSIGSKKFKIRVLEIIGNAIIGGMESTVYDLIRGLPANEFEVTCICPYESPFTEKLRDLGCEVFVTAIRDDPPWNSIELVATVIRQRSINIVHAHLMNAHTLAAISGRLTAVPVVATIHSMTLWAQEVSVARIAGSHLITVCQQAFLQAQAMGVSAQNISLIANGVDVERFRPDRERLAFRDSIRVPLAAPLLGFVGRLSAEKSPDKFVLAADWICRHREDTHFVLVGDGPEREALEGAIWRSEFRDRIHLIGSRQNMELVYPAFDLILQTSRTEAMPLVVLEAMASGLPVVALAVGGVAEIIEAAKTGIHISPVDPPGSPSAYPGDWHGIARAALQLLAKPELIRQMGQAGRQRVLTRFNLERNLEQVAALFRHLTLTSAKSTTLSAFGDGKDRKANSQPRLRHVNP